MRRLRHLTGQHRTASTNRLLGALLAFNAGAINAGGFLLVSLYTSHMTGFASMLADNLILGNVKLVSVALGALLAFTAGAAVTAVLVNWARQNWLRSEYALPLLVEALLLLLFGLLGATLNRQAPFAVPLTVLVLAFIMGLQNALVSKISASQIRTTHMTGVITDLGIELGKLFYWNHSQRPPESRVRANRIKLRLFATLLGMFVAGGLVGAFGFKYVGFIWVLPLALVLLALSLPPLYADLQRILRIRRKLKASRQTP
ncbi:YoaK family protein [Polaromonas sp.]|uniref:YoaK family protein n=1 Tax=Polaromonas sp. TaxID=1869339 RepID=UPI00286AC38B|nr:YoaK family protein [Polaromonas sp.]